MADDKRPGLARYRLLVNAAEASLKQVKGEYWPVFNAKAEYQNYETDLATLADQWQLGVGLTWEFFSGFETDGKVAQANAQLSEIEAALKSFEHSVTREVTNSYLRAEENRDGVDIADRSLGLAKENLELADGRYKAGIGDVLEFNDAQLLFTENQSNLVITYSTDDGQTFTGHHWSTDEKLRLWSIDAGEPLRRLDIPGSAVVYI